MHTKCRLCECRKKRNKKLFTEIHGQRQTQLIWNTRKYSEQVGYNCESLYKLNCKDVNIEYIVFTYKFVFITVANITVWDALAYFSVWAELSGKWLSFAFCYRQRKWRNNLGTLKCWRPGSTSKRSFCAQFNSLSLAIKGFVWGVEYRVSSVVKRRQVYTGRYRFASIQNVGGIVSRARMAIWRSQNRGELSPSGLKRRERVVYFKLHEDSLSETSLKLTFSKTSLECNLLQKASFSGVK